MTDFFFFFNLLDRIFMLFSYEKSREKNFPMNSSYPRTMQTNTFNLTSGWIQNRARRETGHSEPATSISRVSVFLLRKRRKHGATVCCVRM